MNIGFHYFITKTLAELAGFTPDDAQLIAYACQYVDNAKDYKVMKIKGMPPSDYERMNKDEFDPTCTSHQGIKYIMFDKEDIRNKVLLSFHFIPSGWDELHKKFSYITEPDSPLAVGLVELAIQKLQSTFPGSSLRQLALIGLGISLHSYEDAFAHQGFSARDDFLENGIAKPNIVTNTSFRHLPFLVKLPGLLGLNIGHERLGTYPDKFNTQIAYLDGNEDNVLINTLDRFKHAAQYVYQLLRNYTKVPDEWKNILPKLEICFLKNKNSIAGWEKEFNSQFPGIFYEYKAKKWKSQAIKTNLCGNRQFRGDLKWFQFNQAAYEQRQIIISNLPK
jgi:hypothetical protein